MMLDNRRDYLIEVSKDLTIKDFVMTLCHEMVHVKQYVRKEMDDWNGVAVARWKGGTVLPNTSYYDCVGERSIQVTSKTCERMLEQGNILSGKS